MMDLKLVGRTALATGVGGLLATLVAAFVTFPSHEVGADLVVRTVLVTCVLVLVLPSLLRETWARRRGPGLGSVLAGAVCGYAIDLASWTGRAYAAQLVHSPGALTIAVDLVLWLAVVAVAVQWRLTPARTRRTTSAYLS
jgi:hypothetical protein